MCVRVCRRPWALITPPLRRYSYFYEAFETYNTMSSAVAFTALKYMLLMKIMLNLPQDVHALLTGKIALQFHGAEVDGAFRRQRIAVHTTTLMQFLCVAL